MRKGAAGLQQRLARFDWIDLKFFLAVASKGSTPSAALLSGVNQSTVQRRLADFKTQSGQRLVKRLKSGDRLTEPGTTVPSHAEGVAAQAEVSAKALHDPGRARIGIIRQTYPEPIAFRRTRSGIIHRYRTDHSNLKVAFALSDQCVDPAKGEADVALRSGAANPTEPAQKSSDSGNTFPVTVQNCGKIFTKFVAQIAALLNEQAG